VLQPGALRARVQHAPLGICLVHRCQAHLIDDKGAARIFTIGQPVGIDQPGSVVLGPSEDLLPEDLVHLGIG
jgi:hypothetical protein